MESIFSFAGPILPYSAQRTSSLGISQEFPTLLVYVTKQNLSKRRRRSLNPAARAHHERLPREERSISRLVFPEERFTARRPAAVFAGSHGFPVSNLWSGALPRAVKLLAVLQGNASRTIFYDLKCKLIAQQSIARLRTAFGDEASFKMTLYNWFEEFKHGRINQSDKFRDSRPSTAVNNKHIDAVRV
ncbi:hypothetical protein EVAR_44149_1 [Eumeta japonica]|uniref:Mos1 transposase HTH domain-containing protein n=1 Tax=Eumeta variegata TaxID=151549 RepID=A0A4C1XJH0_EUMVA|nr:hypothetical protein EVAR_44149_1 [Eumeta japonica]